MVLCVSSGPMNRDDGHLNVFPCFSYSQVSKIRDRKGVSTHRITNPVNRYCRLTKTNLYEKKKQDFFNKLGF